MIPIPLGKRSLFLISNAIIAFGVGIYLIVWLLAGVQTEATITKPYAQQLQVRYKVDGSWYQALHMRNNVDFGDSHVDLLYLPWQPQRSSIFSFMGLAAEPLAWWGVYLTASAMLLLTNNSVFSKGTRFNLYNRFPYISMDEFFPAAQEKDRQKTSAQAHPHPISKIKRLRGN